MNEGEVMSELLAKMNFLILQLTQSLNTQVDSSMKPGSSCCAITQSIGKNERNVSFLFQVKDI